MFVKHIIKTLHISVTITLPSSGGRLSCLVLLLHSLFVCVIYLVCGCNDVYVRVCLMYFSQRRKQAEEVVTALSTKDDPLKMVK